MPWACTVACVDGGEYLARCIQVVRVRASIVTALGYDMLRTARLLVCLRHLCCDYIPALKVDSLTSLLIIVISFSVHCVTPPEQ